MRAACLSLVAVLCLTSITPSPADAYLNPYVRVGFGGNQARMDEANEAIKTEINTAYSGGVPVSPQAVGPGYGPTVGAGFWLVPGLRVGATYAQQRSRVDHEYRQTGFLYANNFEFRMNEIGLEAAVRIPALAGFTFGGNAAESKGEFAQRFALENVHGRYYEDVSAARKVRTYAVFLGFDQTAPNGLAGFVHVGYHWRDVGPMPGVLEIDDNGTISQVSGETVPMDYTGWSVRVGAGFDLNW